MGLQMDTKYMFSCGNRVNTVDMSWQCRCLRSRVSFIWNYHFYLFYNRTVLALFVCIVRCLHRFPYRIVYIVCSYTVVHAMWLLHIDPTQCLVCMRQDGRIGVCKEVESVLCGTFTFICFTIELFCFVCTHRRLHHFPYRIVYIVCSYTVVHAMQLLHFDPTQ